MIRYKMIEIIIIILAIIVFIFLCTVGWAIGTYNWFVNLKQSTKTQWSNIKAEYQRRADLFANLATSVKSHKKFEKETLKEVIEARSKGITGTMPQQKKKMQGMDAVFSKLLAVFEKYPELKSIEQYNKFTDEVRITEDRVNIARTDYNDIVREYNIGIKVFPKSIIANMFKFSEEKFYANNPSSEKEESYRVSLD